MTVDARGLDCPRPVIKTKNALEKASGEPLLVMVSNVAARDNVIRFLKRSGAKIDRVEEKDDEFHIYTQAVEGRTTQASGELKPEDYTCQTAVTGTTVFINKDRLGLGSDELGKNLLKAFVATIKDLSVQPRRICFMNSGVKLTIKGAETLQYLQELEERGIEILVCGTCLSYFNLSEELGVGKISNMYDISEAMLKSTKVVTI